MKAIAALVGSGAILAAFYGWVANIIALIGMPAGDVTTMFILRIVGIFFPPIGIILGLI